MINLLLGFLGILAGIVVGLQFGNLIRQRQMSTADWLDANKARAAAIPSTLRRAAAGLWAFLVRWQENLGWAPACVGLALLAWIVLGALDRSAALDVLPLLVLLPVKAAYALLALGATYLVAKRSRYRLTDVEQGELHRAAIAGKWGAVALFVLEKVTVLCFGFWLLRFFSLRG